MTFFFINKYDRKLCTKIDFHKLIIYSSKSKLKIFVVEFKLTRII